MKKANSDDVISVLIVEDSHVVRQHLVEIVEDDPNLTVVGAAETAEEALPMVFELRPDVISLDIRLPGMNGLDFTRRVMRECPTPIVVASASIDDEDLMISMSALQAGALCVVEKPRDFGHSEFADMARKLTRQLRLMSQVPVVSQHSRKPVAADGKPREASDSREAPRILGIVASTGGPNALLDLLNALGPEFPLPVVLVQHITSSFLRGFARWLGSVTPFRVELAEDRASLVPGRVYVAAEGYHTVLRGGRIRLERGTAVDGQIPSGTVLLRSIAEDYGAASLGVVLTGMGRDGAAGLFAMHEAGAITLAEAESSAVVFGMPKEAQRLGAADELLPISELGERIRELVDSAQETHYG